MLAKISLRACPFNGDRVEIRCLLFFLNFGVNHGSLRIDQQEANDGTQSLSLQHQNQTRLATKYPKETRFRYGNRTLRAYRPLDESIANAQ